MDTTSRSTRIGDPPGEGLVRRGPGPAGAAAPWTDLRVSVLEPPRDQWRREVEGRVRAAGKFLFDGLDKFHVKGVTYGPFGPEGHEYGSPEAVGADLDRIAAAGFNAIRTYIVPPLSTLEAAGERGVRVLVGLPWEQHVAFLDGRGRPRDIEARVRAGVRACAGHPAVLAYAIGNEIPSPIVRWYGRRPVERYLARLADTVRDEDGDALVTYVSYPSTEYLELPFLDLACFNVFLESAELLSAYVARLHNLAGDRPLILGEIGLDSRRNGTAAQARVVAREVRTAFAAGCAGAFVFGWSDTWNRGGFAVQDWDFGLVARDDTDKPALAAVAEAMAETPFPPGLRWPRMSVVVCSLNGSRTIRDCMDALRRLEYPDFEVVVVNDGSTDETARIARTYGFPVITVGNGGLSKARNLGMRAATGEIVAYIDDDAYPDPDWLRYLAVTFMGGTDAAVGGPNLAPPGDGAVAEAVAHAPGGPTHVLVTDREAEHIPGCNMAFRKDVLEELGGFDPRFRVAGDDVDLCWRLQDRGWTIGFSPAAVVWHHRRNSIRAYWRQQRGYGRAEALLERKWPERYNPVGHVAWGGSVYGPGSAGLRRSGGIYHGVWGQSAFQKATDEPGAGLWSLFTMPEWYLAVGTMFLASALGVLWRPLVVGAPVALVGALASIAAAWRSSGAAVREVPGRLPHPLRQRALAALLHVIQPMARLRGRLRGGLTPWRQRTRHRAAMPVARTATVWRERWLGASETLTGIEEVLRSTGAVVLRAGPTDRFDLEVRGGSLGAARLLMAIEEHGSGRQLVRFRSWPRPSTGGLLLVAPLAGVAAMAELAGAWMPGAVLALSAGALGFAVGRQCAAACGALLHSLGGAK
jgi:O-antigen biosynthesis protein